MVEIAQLRSETVGAILRAYEARRWSGDALRLSPSDMGQECSRKIWSKHRWVHPPEVFDGAKLRLFEAGKAFERRIIAELRDAGVTVDDLDPATGKPFEVKLLGGHMRGKIEGFATGIVEAPKARHVLEAKSLNNKAFTAFLKSGVAIAKPDHEIQVQLYLHGFGVERGYYIAENRDTTELHAERVRYDLERATRIVARAEHILTAREPPMRQHDDPEAKAAWLCRSCPAIGNCHRGEWAPRNCRTCIHATPKLDGDMRWWCERHHVDLSVATQKVGCAAHLFIPGLVPGEPLRSNMAEEWVEYRLRNGAIWRDQSELIGEVQPPTAEETRAAIAEAVEGDEVVF